MKNDFFQADGSQRLKVERACANSVSKKLKRNLTKSIHMMHALTTIMQLCTHIAQIKMLKSTLREQARSPHHTRLYGKIPAEKNI